MQRRSGILLPITSLSSSHGIGDLGPAAYDFVDFCKAAGQTRWQILPINPTDAINGHSPYSCASAFAGNSLLISLQLLSEDGLLSLKDVSKKIDSDPRRVNYEKAIILKEKLLTKAYINFLKIKLPNEYIHFVGSNSWLHDYALFITIKATQKNVGWDQWPLPLRRRQPKALQKFSKKHQHELNRIKFIQYIFYKQWVGLRSYANAQGVKIIGDIPIYVNYDSVDVWCDEQFFQIKKHGGLKFISGCPPDYFSKTGQRWGNPTYNWANLKKDKYDWWVKRIRHNLLLFDFLRIDHFRGFVSFWQIPAHEKLAVFGKWVKAPGEHFFTTLKKLFPQLPLIAEDLGEITDDVKTLMKKFNFPGMRVLLFAFGGDPKINPHVPKNYTANSVVYTGTHDNNTVQGWFFSESKDYERALLQKVLGGKIVPSRLHWTMMEVLEKSQADTVILSMPDILGLREEARFNTPGTITNNWMWRLTSRQLTQGLAHQLKQLTSKAKRHVT